MKQRLKRFIPDTKTIHENRYLRIFGRLLQDPNLWHLNRRSVSGAFGVGLFAAFLPPLGQHFLAAALAIWLRVNLPLAVTLVWISNPLTIPPIFYFAYWIGCLLSGEPAQGFNVQFWLDWHNWLKVTEPLLLGSLVCASVSGILGYLSIQILWRRSVARRQQARRSRRPARGLVSRNIAPADAAQADQTDGEDTPSQ